jgi:hypothetical protein
LTFTFIFDRHDLSTKPVIAIYLKRLNIKEACRWQSCETELKNWTEIRNATDPIFGVAK